MIKDSMKNSNIYEKMDGRIQKAFDYLRNTDLKSIKPGKYEIDGNKMFASIEEYQTRSIDEALFEGHKKYLDIQFIISGEEKIGYIKAEDINITKPYDDTKDIYFGSGIGENITLKEGDFMILFPQDGHMPCLDTVKKNNVKKIVIKIMI